MTNYQNTVLNFLDIETTGGSSKVDRIIEIFISKVKDGQVIKTFHTLINPGFRPNPFILKLTNISNADLENSPYFEDIAEDLYEFLKDGVIVAHNARFDYSFIKQELKNYGFEINWNYCCTVKLSRNLYPQFRSHKLDNIVQRINYAGGNRHRAEYDAEVVRAFFYAALAEHGSERFLLAYNRSIQQSAVPADLIKFNIKDIPETPGVYIFYDYDNYPIYVGMSKNLRRRVKEHFYQDLTNSKDLKINQKLNRIETIPTAGILGAYIRESILVKKFQPLYNRMLRRNKELIKLEYYIDDFGYINLRINNDNDFNINNLDNLIGVYKSRIELKEKLDELTKKHGLCSKLMGLEKTKYACFAHQLSICKGACIHKIDSSEYNQMFENAFKDIRIANWPAESEIQIKEESESISEELYFNKWGFIKSSLNDDIFKEFSDNFKFDLDIYKILYRYLKNKEEFIEMGD